MTRYSFALSTAGQLREAGVIQSDTFDDALEAIGTSVPVDAGDTLEIAVRGFPPARYECVTARIGGQPVWRPWGQLAA